MAGLRQLAAHTAVYGLSSVLGRAINWLLTPVLLHAYSLQNFGLYQDVLALATYPLIVLAFGQSTALFRWSSGSGPDAARQADAAYRNALATVGLLCLGFAALGLLLAPRLAPALGWGPNPGLVRLLVGVVVLDVLAEVPLSRLRYRQKARRFATIMLTNIGLLVGLTLWVVYGLQATAGIEPLMWINLAASALKLGLALQGNLPNGWRPSRASWKPMRQYGQFIMIAGLAGALNEALDRNLLPRLWPHDGALWQGQWLTGYEMNAIYGAVYKLAMVVGLATQAFRFAAEPYFFKQAANPALAPVRFARVLHYYALVGLFIVVAVAAFRYELAAFDAFGLLNAPLLPPRYWVGLQVVPVLLFSALLLGVYLNLSMWFKVTGQVRFALLFTGAGAIVTVGVNLLLIPLLGYVACAWASLVAHGLMCALCLRVGQRYYPVPYRWPRLSLYALSALLLLLLNEGLANGQPQNLGPNLLKITLMAAWLAGLWWLETRRPVFA